MAGTLPNWLEFVRANQETSGQTSEFLNRADEIAAKRYYNHMTQPGKPAFTPEVWKQYAKGSRPFDVTNWGNNIRIEKGAGVSAKDIWNRNQRMAVSPLDVLSSEELANSPKYVLRSDNLFDIAKDPIKDLATKHPYSTYYFDSMDALKNSDEYRKVLFELMQKGGALEGHQDLEFMAEMAGNDAPELGQGQDLHYGDAGIYSDDDIKMQLENENLSDINNAKNYAGESLVDFDPSERAMLERLKSQGLVHVDDSGVVQLQNQARPVVSNAGSGTPTVFRLDDESGKIFSTLATNDRKELLARGDTLTNAPQLSLAALAEHHGTGGRTSEAFMGATPSAYKSDPTIAKPWIGKNYNQATYDDKTLLHSLEKSGAIRIDPNGSISGSAGGMNPTGSIYNANMLPQQYVDEGMNAVATGKAPGKIGGLKGMAGVVLGGIGKFADAAELALTSTDLGGRMHTPEEINAMSYAAYRDGVQPEQQGYQVNSGQDLVNIPNYLSGGPMAPSSYEATNLWGSTFGGVPKHPWLRDQHYARQNAPLSKAQIDSYKEGGGTYTGY